MVSRLESGEGEAVSPRVLLSRERVYVAQAWQGFLGPQGWSRQANGPGQKKLEVPLDA